MFGSAQSGVGDSSGSTFESTLHRSIEDINENQLNSFVTQSDGGTMFHRYDWLAAVEDALEREPRHILVTNDGNPVGFLPNFVADLPLPDAVEERLSDGLPFGVVEPPPPGYGGPIVSDERVEVLDRLFDKSLLADGPESIAHFVQTFDTDAVRYGRYLESLGYEPKLTECTFFLDLSDDWETILSNMDKGRRRRIGNALDQTYEVEIEALGDDLDATYDQYVANIERVGGDRLPRQFLEAIAARLPERVRVFTAIVDGDDIGRYVYLLDEEKSVLHHWLSAIGDSDDFDRYPSELLHQRAIRWGRQEGFDRYSFGPVSPHFANSVFQFKEKYGGRPIQSCRWERGTLPGVWHAYDFARSWYRRSQTRAR